MEFKTLEDTSIAELMHTFNDAFSDYSVPFHLTKEQLLNKIVAESIHKEFSFGAFEDGKLIAFILHGIATVEGQKIAYNAGSGVIPDKRGNKFISKLYETAFPLLKQNSIRTIRLEVLSDNEVAKKIYSALGFTKKRILNCYKGSIADHPSEVQCSIQYIYQPDWKLLQSFWDWNPSWQNSISSINNSWSQLDTIGIYSDDTLVGYAVLNPKLNRILQFSISKEHRQSGFAKQLFRYIALNKSKTISLLNIDDQAVETHSFLTSSGLTVFLNQIEMELTL